MLPGCAPGGASAAVTFPQHGHASGGSRYSVTNLRDLHVPDLRPPRSRPARRPPARSRTASTPRAAASSLAAPPGPGPGTGQHPGCPGCPPRLRSLRRSRSEACRCLRSALRRSFAPIGSFDGGVPEFVLSRPSRRSSSATRSSSRRYRSRAASSSARSIAFSASFASTTARSRASSSRCSAAPADGSGASGTSPDHAQPQLQVQAPCAVCHAGLAPVTDTGAGSQGLTQRPGYPGLVRRAVTLLTTAFIGASLAACSGAPGTPGTSRTRPGHILGALAELF